MTLILDRPRLNARHSTLSDLEPLELVYSHMPKWLLDAEPGVIDALNASMAQSRAYHERVGKKFSQLQSVDSYCGALLEAELKREFALRFDIHLDQLAVVHERLITDDTLLATVRHRLEHDEPKSLLWAALQNFSADEALADGFHAQSHIRLDGHPEHLSPLKPHYFAAVCRTLDLGAKYQTYLQTFLGVAPTGEANPDATQLATESNLRLLKIYDMQVDAHIAWLKKNITETSYKALVAVLVPPSQTATTTTASLDGKPVVLSSISLLDTPIDGVVIFSPETLLLHPGNRLIAYIPNDPVAPFFEFTSLQVFTDELKQRLQDPAYVSFFSRFVALSARAAFVKKLNERPVYLGLTADVLSMSAAHYLCTVQLKNMFADAQLLAVPTGVLDERLREERWQLYKGVGLLLINVAALFVPVLGDLMLAVAIGDMLKEVYEGVEDWTHGDTDHAREHLLTVAKDIAVNVAVVVGVSAIKAAASRLNEATRVHFEGFEAIKREDGAVRLWNRNLEHYENPSAHMHRYTADARGFFTHQARQHITVAAKHYPVEFDRALQQWRIPHARRPQAFKPALLHNGDGAWQLAHELPLEWQGSAAILGRLGGAAATLDERTLEQVRQLTHTSEEIMRRVHLENLLPPPLLAITLKRFEIDRALTAFVEQMSTPQYNAAHWAHWQLSLLPYLQKWPAGKGFVVADESGQSLARYGSTLWPTTSQINLTSAVLHDGKLLEAVLAALPADEGKALLSHELSQSPKPVSALAKTLADYLQGNRKKVFERFYQAFDVSRAPEAKTIEAAFPGLPKAVTQALVESASTGQRQVLRTAKVPLKMAETARFYLREARLDRAIEGFYLKDQANADTERLMLHFLDRLPGWPADIRWEVRTGSLQGSVTRTVGNTRAPITPRVLVKTEQGVLRYKPRGSIYTLEPGISAELSDAMFESLTPLEREGMGLDALRGSDTFNEALAAQAANARQESAQVLGMQPIKPGFKPPSVMPDGQIGYPLCGLDAGGHSSALQRRVRELFPEYSQEQVLDCLDMLVESGVEPLRALRERKRVRTSLRNCLQTWIDSTPSEIPLAHSPVDHAEDRYQAAGIIERIWRRHPRFYPQADSVEGRTLNLSGLRVGSFPVLPVMADFTHIRVLKLNNMNCKNTADSFLEHFSGVEVLEMDNNQMNTLPLPLETMANLRHLSLAQNELFMNAANQSMLLGLSKLEVLNLTDNFLGAGLDLSRLNHLRRIYLRRTWIDTWPQALASRPLLEAADLRQNHIAEIPEDIFQTSPRVTRNITLSNNPLSAASRLRLARFVMQGGSTMGVDSEALLSEAAAFEFWTAGITSHERSRRELLWNTLRSEPNSEDFFNVVSRLTTTADAQSVRQDLSRRVWEVIEAANENADLRRDVIDIAAAPRSCTDSVALSFSALEIQVELARISTDPTRQESDLINLGRRLYRLDKLTKIASEHYTLQLATGVIGADELEVLLAYRTGLAKPLNLPGQPQSMMFNNLAGVTAHDLNTAQLQITSGEGSAELNAFISTLDCWRAYLIERNKADYLLMTEPFHDELNALLRRSPEMTSGRYVQLVTGIRHRMDASVDVWCLNKTNESVTVGTASSSPSTDL